MPRRPELREAWERTRVARDLATALVQARTAAGLNQAQLARKAGWDKAFVSRLEDALSGTPDLATLARYLQACGRDGESRRREARRRERPVSRASFRSSRPRRSPCGRTPALPPGEDDAFARLVEREFDRSPDQARQRRGSGQRAPVVQQEQAGQEGQEDGKENVRAAGDGGSRKDVIRSMQLAADLVGLLGVLFFAVPAIMPIGLAWLSARLANLKVVFADPGQEARRQKIIADLAAQQDAWTPVEGLLPDRRHRRVGGVVSRPDRQGRVLRGAVTRQASPRSAAAPSAVQRRAGRSSRSCEVAMAMPPRVPPSPC